mgnify:CR=1 FL=1
MMDAVSKLKFVLVIVLIGASGGAVVDTSLYFDTQAQCEAARASVSPLVASNAVCVEAYRVGAQ